MAGFGFQTLPGEMGQAPQAPPPAPMPPPVPPPQQQPQAQEYQPSKFDIFMDMLANGHAPSDAAEHVRALDYQKAQQAYTMRALQNMDPAQREAILFGGAEAAKNYGPQVGKPGDRIQYFGPGGPSRDVPTTGVTPGGLPFTQSPGRFQPNGPQLPGKKTMAPNGTIVDENLGLTGQSAPIPQIIPPGSTPSTFSPGQPTPPASGAGGGASLDPVAFFRSFVLPHEGGLNPRDLNGAPTRFGINQAANPDVDVSKLTPEAAADIFAKKYFAQSGAAHLPAPLAAVHADTSFINPKKAAEFLTQSGGDPGKYMDMREAWLNGLVQKFPGAQKYAGAWASRNADLRRVAGQLAGQTGQAGQGAQGWSVGQQVGTPSILSPDAAARAGFAPGAVVEQDPAGGLSVKQPPEYGPEAKSKLRSDVLGSEDYKMARSANAAYSAMIANAGKMNGPSGYAMLDTFARAINPGAVARPQVIETISKSLGLPATVVGGWYNMMGQGRLTPQAQQQILDAVQPFVSAHWEQANRLNQSNAALAAAHKFDPADVTAPLESRPERVTLQVPPAGQRPPGLYVTPKGPLHWDGKLWHPG